MQFADLHIHSHYSRATSKEMNIDFLSKMAKIKGIDILGTGDFTHPKWLKELQEKLEEKEKGVYEYNEIKFILTSEISLIYKQDGKTRKIHHIILSPSFEITKQINEWLDKKGRRDYDGRPIFGFSSVELLDEIKEISDEIEIIPAHAWTPWFSIFGSKSGFDSIKECFREKYKKIKSIETGLSSDPSMNWRFSELDRITLISNSDSHSPLKIGREANVFGLKKEFSYKEIINSIRTRKNFLFTIEVEPAYGKYHYDGHRKCNISLNPKETKENKGICPKCKKPLTIGVLNRVEELADREEGFVPKNSIPYKSLLPLLDIISFSLGYGIETKKVSDVYWKLIRSFGNEFNVLLNVEIKEIEKVAGSVISNIILYNREGKLKIEPGYDGVYGKIIQQN